MKFQKFFLLVILVGILSILISQKLFADTAPNENDLYDCAVYQLGEINAAQAEYLTNHGYYYPPDIGAFTRKPSWNSDSIVGSTQDLETNLGGRDYPLDFDSYLSFRPIDLAEQIKYRCRYNPGVGRYCFAYRCDAWSDYNDPTTEVGCKPNWILRWKVGEEGLDKCTLTPIATVDVCS